jgi:heme/copper-type cytochrome/quinol oxidase subunit 3
MTARRVLDVSALPDVAFGHRDPLWWGAIGMVAIETTMVVLLVSTYLYVRGDYHEWPPVGFGARVQTLAAIEAALLAASWFPVMRANDAALRGDLRAIRRWVVVSTLAGVAFVVLRGLEIAAMPFPWHQSGYASVVWALIVLNTTHVGSSVLEIAVTGAVAFTGPFEKKHLVDVHTSGFLWYFVVASWIPVWALVYLAPGLLRP